MVTWPIAWRIHSNCNNGVSRLLSVGGELISEAVCSLSLIRCVCVSTWSLRCHHARTTARAAIYLLSQETAHEHSHQCSFLSLRMWCREEMYPRPQTPHPTPLFGSSSYEHNRLISLQWWTSIVGKISRTQTHKQKKTFQHKAFRIYLRSCCGSFLFLRLSRLKERFEFLRNFCLKLSDDSEYFYVRLLIFP